MLSQLLHPRPTADVRDDFVIARHHPDRLGRPTARLGALHRDRFQQAVTWNVFRTLELIAPAFWLRRLHIRLAGAASLVPPQIVRVSLWRPLPLPPVERIDGARPDVVADVVIETEHAVWTLLVAPTTHPEEDDRMAQTLAAGMWLAGARQHSAGVIETQTTSTSFGGVLRKRYARSRDSVDLRSAIRGAVDRSSAPPGTLEWRDLAAILGECQDAPNLAPIERALARNAVEWLRRAGGVEPVS